jgi:hypothetical protein
MLFLFWDSLISAIELPLCRAWLGAGRNFDKMIWISPVKVAAVRGTGDATIPCNIVVSQTFLLLSIFSQIPPLLLLCFLSSYGLFGWFASSISFEIFFSTFRSWTPRLHSILFSAGTSAFWIKVSEKTSSCRANHGVSASRTNTSLLSIIRFRNHSPHELSQFNIYNHWYIKACDCCISIFRPVDSRHTRINSTNREYYVEDNSIQ